MPAGLLIQLLKVRVKSMRICVVIDEKLPVSRAHNILFLHHEWSYQTTQHRTRNIFSRVAQDTSGETNNVSLKLFIFLAHHVSFTLVVV